MTKINFDPFNSGLAALAAVGNYARRNYIAGCKVRVVVSTDKSSAAFPAKDGKDGATLHELLQSECPSLTDPSKAYMIPTPYLCTGLLQTFYATCNRKSRDATSDITYDRELLVMEDGGTVSLDWYPSKEPRKGEEKLPIIFMIGGVGGSSEEYFMRASAKSLAHGPQRFRAAVFNHRGTARMPVTSPRPYDAGFTSDIREVVKHVCDKSGSLVRIMAVGFSMGANVLTKYVGEEGTECLLSAAVAVCCPFDIKVAGEAINADNFLNNKVFLPQVVKSMKSCLKHAKTVKTAKAHPEWVNEIDDIMAATKPYQIEKQLITKINRCSSLDEYYSMASSTNYVDKIRIPYLAINSLDDRITPPEGIPVQKFKENRYLSLALVRHGGHLAFLTGTLSPKFWFIKPIQEFTSAMAKL